MTLLAVALAAAGFAYGVEEFVLLSVAATALLGIGLVLLLWRAAVTTCSLEVSVHVPRSEVQVGHSVFADVHVRNSGRTSSAPVELEDIGRRWSLSHPGLGPGRAASAVEEEGASKSSADPRSLGNLLSERRRLGEPIRLPGLHGGAEVSVPVQVPTDARGLLTLEPVKVWCEDPMRLLACKVASSPLVHVLVCPAPEAPDISTRPPASGTGNRPPDLPEATRPEGTQGGYEFRSLRPYVPGDRLTRLHWPAFARSGELAVREFVEPVAGCVLLLVDLRPTSHAERSVEAVVSRAAGVGIRALEEGQLVELCTSTGERVEIRPGTGSRRSLQRALAVLGPATAPFSAAMRWGGTGRPIWAASNTDTSEVVVITTRKGADNAVGGALADRAETVIVG